MPGVEDYRQQVIQRAHRRCEYCLYPQAASSTLLEIDHIIPESKGGLTKLDNLALACRHCNSHKWAKTEGFDPITRERLPLLNNEFRIQRILNWKGILTPPNSGTNFLPLLIFQIRRGLPRREFYSLFS